MEYNGLMTPLSVIDGEKIKPSLEATYGPYANIDEAYSTLSNEFGATGIPIGLTVGIKTGNNIEEYWFNGGTSKANLVKKCQSSGVGGGSGDGFSIFKINSTSFEDTTSNLYNMYPQAAVGDHVINTATGAVYIKYGAGEWVKLNGTILGDAAPTIARIVNAHVLSYK